LQVRVRHILVAVNKLDLFGYDEAAFRTIERDFRLVLEQIAADTGNPVEAIFVPVSALLGDNIVHRTEATPWYRGPSLLELLEAAPTSLDTRTDSFRFPVQRVIRPDHTFRGFAGQIASGTIRKGDSIAVLPSGRTAEIERIVTWDGDLAEAHAPLSVTLVLNHEVDISRGDLIVSADSLATVAKRVKAALVWMDQRPLERGRRYLLKHTSHTVPAFVSSIEYRTDISTLSREAAETLEMNGIGVVSVTLLRPMALDLYGKNRSTGAFILIDPETNATVAAGMVTGTSEHRVTGAGLSGPVTEKERFARWGHRGGVLALNGPAEAIDQIERSLFLHGVVTVRIEAEEEPLGASAGLQELMAKSIAASGLVALAITPTDSDEMTARVGEDQIEVNASEVEKAVAEVNALLERNGICRSPGQIDWEI